jgi:hypothetical protein
MEMRTFLRKLESLKEESNKNKMMNLFNSQSTPSLSPRPPLEVDLVSELDGLSSQTAKTLFHGTLEMQISALVQVIHLRSFH